MNPMSQFLASVTIATTGIDFANGGGIPELMKFQEHFRVKNCHFDGLNCDDIAFDGQVES